MKQKNKSRLAAMIIAALAVFGIGGAAVAQSNSGSTTAPTAQAPAPADNETLQEDKAADDATEAPEAEEAPDANEAAEADDPAGADDQVDEQSPSYTSSIAAPADVNGEGVDDEAAEAEALAGLATVTPEEAKAAALAAVSGEVIQVELDNENGAVVYSVEIDTGSGTVDVKVDAGNATILHQDTGNDTEAEG